MILCKGQRAVDTEAPEETVGHSIDVDPHREKARLALRSLCVRCRAANFAYRFASNRLPHV
jgi:hypothetical protein